MVPYLLLSFLLLVGCQTHPASHVQVSSTYPPGNCKELGQVIGTSNHAENAHQEAMDDLRQSAANRQGNYVRILAQAAHGAAVRGIAYRCQ